MADQSNKPLSGLKVIECGVLLAGPFCGQLLADFGAEVIKVEQPGVGDPMRKWSRSASEGKSLWWPIVGRNKKSVTLNLRVPEGQAILKDLVKDADILLENFRPGTFERWGLGYDVLSKINPRLIMTRVSGYGQTGPYSHKAGYASVGEAMSGMRYLMGSPDRLPSRAGISIGDTLAATYAALGCMMAIESRHKTGRGQVVDASIVESCMAMMESTFSEYVATGFIRERSGPNLPGIAPSNIYPSKDGLILIAANQDTVFARLTKAMGQPELATDPDYIDHESRGRNEKTLDKIIADWSSAIETDTLLELLEDAGVPSGRINSAADVVNDPHVQDRNALVEIPHAEFGTVTMQNVVPKLSDTPGGIAHAAPDLGAHNAEVFGSLGLDAAEIAELKSAKVI